MERIFISLLITFLFPTLSWPQDKELLLEKHRKQIKEYAPSFTEEQRVHCFEDCLNLANACFIQGNSIPSIAYNAALLSKELYTALRRVGRGQRDASQVAYSLQATWSDIQAALPEQACAVEFVDYVDEGKTKMGAIVLSKQGNPVWLDLPSPDQIYECPVKGEKASRRIFSKIQDKKNELYNSCNMICGLLWPQSLVNSLKSEREVFFSPANYQHFIAIEYVVPSELEHVRFHRLSSTRKLLETRRSTDTSKALLCGGVVYNKQVLRTTLNNDSLANQFFGVLRLHYLPGSRYMTDSIYTMRNNGNDTFISGVDAEEGRFLELCKKNPYVFISTHGLFMNASMDVKTKYPRSGELLSHSALLMSGGTYQNENVPLPSRTGLLSAKEFSETDLSNVELFVLSACKSGLGYLTDDGIYGLQKGLQLSGVRCIVSTLWELDDTVNVDFMSLFNLYLSKGHTPDDAMYLTRKDFMSRTENAEPRYYDVFIVTDGWR